MGKGHMSQRKNIFGGGGLRKTWGLRVAALGKHGWFLSSLRDWLHFMAGTQD